MYGGGKVREGEREKGSCGEGERADGYGLTVERSRRRGVNGWARRRRRRRWAGLGSARRRRRGGVCVCVNVRGRVRAREKFCVRNETFVWEMKM